MIKFLSRFFGRESETSAPVRQGYRLTRVQRTSGSYRGSMRDWKPRRNVLRTTETSERELTELRIEDLFRNDPVTRSVVNSLVTNVVGKGLTPQSILPYERLGITVEKARELQDQIEWLFFEWAKDAHYRNQFTFDNLQAMAVRSLVKTGEFIHLPILEKHPRPGCRFRLRLQEIDPRRLKTPFGRMYDPHFHDGIEVDETGIPIAYWIFSPRSQLETVLEETYSEEDFLRYPAILRLGRKGIFHVFSTEEDEQFRGSSALSPVVSFLRNFTDSIDNELLAQVVASSFPIFIALENGVEGGLPDYVKEESFSTEEEKRFYQDVQGGGQILYGNAGEKPEVLENARPSANFQTFCTLLLRMIGASFELPYEAITKDFSKTNYSSARAALLEAYRVYDSYRHNLINQYCQPIFSMVLEEAYLSGFIDLPCTVQEFYRDKSLWTNARWVAPARGYIDPQKEAQANIALLEAGLISRSEIIAERGGDFDEVVQRLADEDKMIKMLRPDASLSVENKENQNSVPNNNENIPENEDSGQNSDENENKNERRSTEKDNDKS